MNHSLYMPIIDGTVRMVEVVFYTADYDFDQEVGSGKHYAYKCDQRVDVGDYVVVEARDKLSVARVAKVGVTLPTDDTVYRWVVDVIDMENHRGRLKFERDVVEQLEAKRVGNLRAQMLAALGITQEDVLGIVQHVTNDGSDVIED